MCSILHPLHSAALSDLIDAHNPDLFCLTETWIKPTTTSAELLNCTPPNYNLLSVPRNHSGNSSGIGGGTGFLIREPFTQLPTSHPDFSSFELSSITLQLPRSKIYLPITSTDLLRHLHFLNQTLFFLRTSVPSFLSLLPTLMNSSSLVTLTFTSIILRTTSPLSFSLFSPPSTLLNMLKLLSFQPTTNITFLTWSSPLLTAHLPHLSLPPTALHQIISLSSPHSL